VEKGRLSPWVLGLMSFARASLGLEGKAQENVPDNNQWASEKIHSDLLPFNVEPFQLSHWDQAYFA
jgi:hypothetical protein